jgi:Ulp1 family protease
MDISESKDDKPNKRARGRTNYRLQLSEEPTCSSKKRKTECSPENTASQKYSTISNEYQPACSAGERIKAEATSEGHRGSNTLEKADIISQSQNRKRKRVSKDSEKQGTSSDSDEADITSHRRSPEPIKCSPSKMHVEAKGSSKDQVDSTCSDEVEIISQSRVRQPQTAGKDSTPFAQETGRTTKRVRERRVPADSSKRIPSSAYLRTIVDRSETETLSRIRTFFVNKSCIQRLLSPTSWLIDTVIDTYAAFLNKHTSADTCVYNTQLMNSLKAHGVTPNLFRWFNPTVGRRRSIKISQLNKLIVPLKVPAHWLCFCVNFPQRKIIEYDSSHDGERHLKELQLLRDCVEAVYHDQTGKRIPYHLELTKAQENEVPQQKNGIDCGVFVCEFMRCLASGVNFAFSQADIPFLRRRIAYEILKNSELPPLPDLP